MPGSGGGFPFFPFVERDDAFALVADVDQDDVAVDAEDASFDDLIELHFLGGPGNFLGSEALQQRSSVQLAILPR